MDWSFQLGTIKGIKIKFHWTFIFIILWGSYSYGSGNGLLGLLYGGLLTILIFVIVLLHELGHSLVAMSFGIKVRDITLLPIGGMARLERMPGKPWQEFLVAIAGPAVNFVLAAAIFPFLFVSVLAGQHRLSQLIFMPAFAPNLWSFFQFLFLVNVSLLLFNLLPAFPMDGGRMLRAFLAMGLGAVRATKVAVWVGQGIAFVMAGYAIWSGQLLLALIAGFIFVAGSAEKRSVMVREVLANIQVRDVVGGVMNVLLPSYTLGEVAGLALRSPQASYPVMLGGTLLGILRRADVKHALNNGHRLATVAEFMQRRFPKVDVSVSLATVQEAFEASGTSVAAVYDGERFIGLIDAEDLERAYQFYNRRRLQWI